MLRILALAFMVLLNACHSDTKAVANDIEYAYFSVPEDYSDSSSTRRVYIHYAIHHASLAEQRIGTLFFNFGGPGNNAAAVLKGLFNEQGETLPALQEISQYFDFVAMDPRGSGQSPYAKELRACAQRDDDCQNEYAKFASFMGSNTIVQDMEQLRLHLGENKISYLGYSYGTRLGALYAHYYPEHIRALVLDSPMSPFISNFVDISLQQAAGDNLVANTRLESPERVAKLESLYAVREQAYTANDGVSLSQQELDQIIDNLLSTDWEEPQQAIFQATITLLDTDEAKPVKQALAQYIDTPTADELRTDAMFKAVVCTDESSTQSLMQWTEQRQQFVALSPIFGIRRFDDAKQCIDWPFARDPIALLPEKDSALSDLPVLLIAGELDTNTPYQWGLAMRKVFSESASLVSVSNLLSHGFSYFKQLSCVDESTSAYLINPLVLGSDKTCDVVR